MTNFGLIEDVESPGFGVDDAARLRQKVTYYGKHRAYVRDVGDPLNKYRVRTYCPAVMGPDDDEAHWLDWAEGCFPTGGNPDEGDAYVPTEGAGVWIEFEQGDVRHPIWVGCWYAGDTLDKSEVPNLAKGRGDRDASTQAPKGVVVGQSYLIDEASEAVITGPAYQETTSPYATQAPTTRVIKTASGHVIELDDTEGEERIHVYHTAGTYTEIDSSGSVKHKTIGKRHDIVVGRQVSHCANERVVLVDGPLGESVGGLVSQVYLDGLRTWVQKECKQWFQSTVYQAFGADVSQQVGGSRKLSVGANDLVNVVGSFSRYISGAASLTTLENLAIQCGNTSQSANALSVTALTGNVSIQALAGAIKTMATLGISLDGGGVGVQIGGAAAVEPLLKGQSVATAATNLSTAVAAGQLASAMGPVPLAPIAPAFVAFATAITLALSPLNKVA